MRVKAERETALCYISYRVSFNGLTGSIYSAHGYSHGVYDMGITDPRDQLDAATTIGEVADVLSDALQLVITRVERRGRDESLRIFKRDVRAAGDFFELLDLKVDCDRVVEKDGIKIGVAYQLTYDFPSRTSTYSEARLSGKQVTFLGDPFVDEKGDEFNPFESFV